MTVTVNELLETARSQLDRISPEQARAEQADGALVVDIRPQAQRARYGEVPGALIIERNVLEWRLDPASDAQHPRSVPTTPGFWCSARRAIRPAWQRPRCSSSASPNATDIVGGLRGWQEAGLPVATGGTLPGQRSPTSSLQTRAVAVPAYLAMIRFRHGGGESAASALRDVASQEPG